MGYAHSYFFTVPNGCFIPPYPHASHGGGYNLTF